MSDQGILDPDARDERMISDEHSRWAGRAAALFKARQLRTRIFGQTLFGEPGWDMLIALYVAESSGTGVTVSGLAEWVGCPSTTGLRWLQVLEAKRLVCRRAHPSDKRMHFVELTRTAHDALDHFFAQVPAL